MRKFENLCIHCKHFLASDFGPSYGKCTKFAEDVQSPVDGEISIRYHYAESERREFGKCGFEGVYFQQKENV